MRMSLTSPILRRSHGGDATACEPPLPHVVILTQYALAMAWTTRWFEHMRGSGGQLLHDTARQAVMEDKDSLHANRRMDIKMCDAQNVEDDAR